MPPVQFLLVGALALAGYYYVGKPIAHGVKKASHGICHVATLGKKCKPDIKK